MSENSSFDNRCKPHPIFLCSVQQMTNYLVDLHISVLKFLSESDHSQWHKQVNSSYDVHVKGLTISFVLDKVISWQWDMNNFLFQPEP